MNGSAPCKVGVSGNLAEAAVAIDLRPGPT